MSEAKWDKVRHFKLFCSPARQTTKLVQNVRDWALSLLGITWQVEIYMRCWYLVEAERHAPPGLITKDQEPTLVPPGEHVLWQVAIREETGVFIFVYQTLSIKITPAAVWSHMKQTNLSRSISLQIITGGILSPGNGTSQTMEISKSPQDHLQCCYFWRAGI